MEGRPNGACQALPGIAPSGHLGEAHENFGKNAIEQGHGGMKAPAFDYHRAETVSGALEALRAAGPDARLLAGGQSLLASLNFRLSAPPLLIDIGRLDELRGITETADGTLRIGALTTHAQIGRSALVARLAPMLAEGAPLIAHPAIRNRGTIGGSLALADPASEWPACAVALQAEIEIVGLDGRRRVPAAEFFHGMYATACGAEELVAALHVPPMATGTRQSCCELARRHGDYALAGLAITLAVAGGRVRDLCAVFFGVGPTPMLARHAAAAAEGLPPAEAAQAAAKALAADLDPQGDPVTDTATRMQLASVLLRRTITRLGTVA